MFMNEYEIVDAVYQHAGHPVLGPAARFLAAYKDEVNAHSDGWPYWAPPVRAAAKLMRLVERQPWDAPRKSATMTELRAALTPIKAFMTRRGLKAGMTLPPLDL